MTAAVMRPDLPEVDFDFDDATWRRIGERFLDLTIAVRRGTAFISNAKLQDGRTALRACIVNFRTGLADVEALVTACRELGEELSSSV